MSWRPRKFIACPISEDSECIYRVLVLVLAGKVLPLIVLVLSVLVSSIMLGTRDMFAILCMQIICYRGQCRRQELV